MLHQLCPSLLIITSLCWQLVASRHIVQQPFYPPYSDYSYTYAGPGPFHQSFQHHHTPFFSPPGTYFDQRQGILRPFPGGGVPVLVDYHKRCSDNFVGLRAHPEQQQYYYVCKPDCVIFGKCQNLQIFNATSRQCAQHPPPEYIPICTGVGRFPLFSDCHLYFKCEEDLQPKIYSCPTSMIFSPASKKCINGNKCTPTQISPQSSYLPEMCANKFPPCFENGVFRSPSDCSLYYKCDLKKNGIYMQTRLKCGQGHFYDLQKKECLPAKEVACDCIQVAELVYPKPNNLPFQPAVYPAQYDLDSMIDGQYPVENADDTVNEIGSDCDRKTNNMVVANSEAVGTTTLSPIDFNDELMQPTETESSVLADYIDMKPGTESEEDEELLAMPLQFVNSSEENANTEGSGFETELPTEQTSTVFEEKLSTVTVARIEETTEPPITINTEPSTLLIKEKLLGQDPEKRETTAITQETEPDEDEADTTVTEAPESLQPEACKNLIENASTGDADTQTKDSSQTQPNKCLTQHTRTNSNTHDTQESIKITTLKETTTPHITTTTSENKTTTQIPNDTNVTVTERDNSEENLLDSALNLESAGTMQSSEKTLTRQTKAVIERRETEHPMATSHDSIQTRHAHLINSNSLEEDISYEDLLQSEITKRTKAEFSEPTHRTKLDLGLELDQQAHNRTTVQNLNKEFSTNRPSLKTLHSQELHEIEQILTTEQKAMTLMPAALNSSDSAATTQFIIDEADDSSEIRTDNFESATQTQEDLTEPPPLPQNPADLLNQSQLESISTNEKSVIDFSEEDFIPVRSKNLKLIEIEGKSSLMQKGFDDDYTTILAEKELTTTTLASALDNKIFAAKENANEIMLFNKVTAIKRRQASLDVAIQATTQISAVTETLAKVSSEQRKSHKREAESEELRVLESEIVKPVPGNEHEDEEVRNNEITSAETIQTTSNSKQQQKAPTTQTPTTKTTFEPSEKQTNSLMLHIRNATDEHQPTLDSPPTRKSLNYILKTKPVTNNKSNKTNNDLVTATPCKDSANKKIPRLEIIAEQPIDIHFSVCASSCDKDHKLNKPTSGNRAVLLKWFARKSQQTLGFETANDVNPDDV